MAGTAQIAGPVLPCKGSKDDHKEEEEDARDFKPDDAADAAEGAEETAQAARNTFGYLAGGLRGGPSSGSSVGSDGWGWRGGSGLGAGGEALTGHPSGDTQTDAQGAADGLRSHFVMMVAAGVGERFS